MEKQAKIEDILKLNFNQITFDKFRISSGDNQSIARLIFIIAAHITVGNR